jgi:hypothetical protein
MPRKIKQYGGRNIINLENINFTIEKRKQFKQYFTLYKPQSISDEILIDKYYTYERNNGTTILKGTLDKNRKYYLISKGGSGIIYGILVPYNEEQIWISVKIIKIIKKINVNELEILKKCNKIIKKTSIQNLPISYGYRLYNKNNIEYMFLYNELSHADAEYWIKQNHTELEWKSFFFQLWFSLHTLQKYIKLVHNDLRLPNILYHTVLAGGYWKYIVDDIEYYVPNCGHVFYIWDYGSAESDQLATPPYNLKYYKDKLDNNIDLIYVHALIDRIKVLVIDDNSSLEEISQLFQTEKEQQIYKHEYNKNKNRFEKSRFEKKFKLALIYYLIENNKIEHILNKYKSKLPPTNIMDMLEQLKKEDNLTYEQIQLLYEKPPQIVKSILTPNKLIHKYLSEFTTKKDTIDSFQLDV